jgi:hypothetical protein
MYRFGMSVLHNAKYKSIITKTGIALAAYITIILANTASSQENSLRTSTHNISNAKHWGNTHFLKLERNMHTDPSSGSTRAVKTEQT